MGIDLETLEVDASHSQSHNSTSEDSGNRGNYDKNKGYNDNSKNNSGNNKFSIDKGSNENDVNSDDKASYYVNVRHKRDHCGEVMAFFKDSLLLMLKSLMSLEDPHNDNCYIQEFVTMKWQFELMKTIFLPLESCCTISQFKYWNSRAGIRGTTKKTYNQWRQGFWHSWQATVIRFQHVGPIYNKHEKPRCYDNWICKEISHQRNKASRVRLLQIMIDKLYLNGKCEEVFISSCYLAFEQQSFGHLDVLAEELMMKVVMVCYILHNLYIGFGDLKIYLQRLVRHNSDAFKTEQTPLDWYNRANDVDNGPLAVEDVPRVPERSHSHLLPKSSSWHGQRHDKCLKARLSRDGRVRRDEVSLSLPIPPTNK
ncbi:hypothetical protein J3Q64DRAFT_1825541 [Phycomyces blakesleeanus]|uniref:Uncharacterized protein n=1 Tax=Phycomyces blakesleeanus TaxID=4837 RepID=A0ABR3ANC8_PHYBL